MAESDDEDYKLPSLSERIQSSLKTQSMLKSGKKYDCESEESEFLQLSERLQNTPHSLVKLKCNDTSDSEDEESEFLKFSERIRNTPRSEAKFKLHLSSSSSSSSENEESEFLKFSERIRQTPQSQSRLERYYDVEDSDSDEEFSNLTEKIHGLQVSKSGNEKQHYEDSDSDEMFSNLITKIREIHTPKSQNKYSKEISDYSLSCISSKQRPNSEVHHGKKLTSSEDTANSCLVSQTANEKEYASMFPTRSDDSLFYKKRAFYTQTLFEFFNRKVFDYQLPKDIPLIWDESLVKTAGLTYCKVRKGVYSCSIKLSSKLLTSFDRLQDTLLHEMCHAAVWMINKQNVSHGPLWQIWASRSKLILPFIDCPARCHTYDVPYRFWYQCASCKWKRGTCRRIKRYHGAVCKRCNKPITLTVNN